MTDKQTSEKVGTQASGVLGDGRTSDDSKTAAGSALSQRQPEYSTSDNAASASSGVLQDEYTGDASKASAASALAQHENKDD